MTLDALGVKGPLPLKAQTGSTSYASPFKNQDHLTSDNPNPYPLSTGPYSPPSQIAPYLWKSDSDPNFRR